MGNIPLHHQIDGQKAVNKYPAQYYPSWYRINAYPATQHLDYKSLSSIHREFLLATHLSDLAETIFHLDNVQMQPGQCLAPKTDRYKKSYSLGVQ